MTETYSFMPYDSSDKTDQNSSENVSNGSINSNASSISSSFSFDILDIDQFALEDEADQLFYEDEQNKTDQNSSENVSNGSANSNASSALPSFSFNISDIDQSELDRAILDLNLYSNDKKRKKTQPKQRQKTPRKHYYQPPASVRFQNNFYRLFNPNGEKVRKPLIKKYHDEAHRHNKSIRPINRDARRVVAVYFNTYADQEDLILQTLQQLISNNVINYKKDEQDFAFSKKAEHK